MPARGQLSPAAGFGDCPTIDHQAATADGKAHDSIAAMSPVVLGIRRASFPELGSIDVRVRTFRSGSDYFRTRFSLSRFLLLRPMRYFVDVNPAVLQRQAPSEGICAIVAHELAHVASLSHGNRFRRLGLIRLMSAGYTVRFERGADLEAIHRGYGDGLEKYRTWVYTHVPPGKLPQKQRNYFSPEEITAIQVRLRQEPDIFKYWSQHMPANLGEIQRAK